MNIKKQFYEGLLTKNPVTVQLLGMCSTMAITTSLFNGLGMGAAVTIILTCSNIIISALRKFIPSQIRIAAYVTIIAGFVTIVDLAIQAFLPDLSTSLGVFIPLIVVNCIILGRAEAFANKNSVGRSALDALGMGAGFTLALILMGSIREILGSGSWFGIDLTFGVLEPIGLFVMPAGGFMVFGFLVAVVNRLSHYQISKKKMGCENCPSRAGCGGHCSTASKTEGEGK